MARVMEANPHENTAEQDEMQIALKNYLEFLESGVYEDCFASNCLVDWFGRSVRGPRKIHQFLICKTKAQLRHAEFNKIEKCEPIEVKPTHMTTKKISKPKDLKIIKSHNDLKTYAESDDDRDEKPSTSVMNTSDNSMDIAAINTPTTSKAIQHVEEDTLGLKILPLSDDDDDDGHTSNNNIAKRPKYNNMSTSTKSRRKIIVSKINSDSEADDVDEEEEVDESERYDETTMNYSSLHYLETTGRLFNLNLPGVLDRTVRLRISYRRHLITNNIQYALIIYECLQDDGKVKVMPRRNLALEFNEYTTLGQQQQQQQHINEDTLVVVSTSDEQQEQINESINQLSTPTRITTSLSTVDNDANDDDDDDMNLVAYTALRTPTKVSTDPPATPRRRRRDGHMHLKRTYDSVPSFSTNADGSRKPIKKCNAARTLRL